MTSIRCSNFHINKKIVLLSFLPWKLSSILYSLPVSPGYLDTSLLKTKFTPDDIFRAGICMMDCYMFDENIQVNGFTVLMDQTHFSHRHAETVFGVDNMKRAVKMFVVNASVILSILLWYLIWLDVLLMFYVSWTFKSNGFGQKVSITELTWQHRDVQV